MMCRNVACIVVAVVSTPAKLYVMLASISWCVIKVYTFEKQPLSELLSALGRDEETNRAYLVWFSYPDQIFLKRLPLQF